MRKEFHEFKLNTALAILYILSKGSAHGYEIMKRIEKEFYIPKSPGILYPILNKLLKEGYVDIEQAISRGRKKLKVYRVTSKGLEFLSKNLDKVEYLKNCAKGFKIFRDLGGEKLRETIHRLIDVLPKASEDDIKHLRNCIESFVSSLNELIDRISSR